MDNEIRQQLIDYAGREITFAELGEKARTVLGTNAFYRVRQELIAGAMEMRNEIIMSMRNSPETGKLYRIGTNKRGKGVYHRASSPGFPPRPNTGRLINSILMNVRIMEVEVGSIITNPPYPVYLEEGTSRMRPRPWLQPAIDKWQPKINMNIRRVSREVAAELVQ